VNERVNTGERKRPLIVRLSLMGIKSRSLALMFVWLCIALTIISLAAELPFLTLYLVFAAWAYWYSLRWVDKNETWPTTAKSNVSLGVGLTITSFLLGIAIKHFFVGFYQIPQVGMYPSLPSNSKIFTNKRAYAKPSDVKRGDVVAFLKKKDGAQYVIIWRIIGLPGDRIEASGELLKINGQEPNRKLVSETAREKIFTEKIEETEYQIAFDLESEFIPPDASITVPPDHFFVMGDNRFNASDSRDTGPIPFSAIIGRKF
jgi:signal peptidase I